MLFRSILMLTAVLSTALSVVREKERGTMEQLRVTSLRPGELIVGKTLPYLAISHGKEALPPQRSATLTTFAAGGVWNVTPVYAVRVDLSHENRHDFYRHNSIGAGLTVRF